MSVWQVFTACLEKLDRIQNADVIIVIAGMEGALASVVGGLVEVPVIAVPTSVGYGASFGRSGSITFHAEQLCKRNRSGKY